MSAELILFNVCLSYLVFAATYTLAVAWFRYIDQPHRRKGALTKFFISPTEARP